MDLIPPVLHVGDISTSDAHMLMQHVRRVNMLGEPIAYVLTQSIFLFDGVHANGLHNESATLTGFVLCVDHRIVLGVETKTNVEVPVFFCTGTLNRSGHTHTPLNNFKTILWTSEPTRIARIHMAP